MKHFLIFISILFVIISSGLSYDRRSYARTYGLYFVDEKGNAISRLRLHKDLDACEAFKFVNYKGNNNLKCFKIK